VHGYLTVEGQKIGKSLGNAIEPSAVVAHHGVDVVRYFLCRHVRSGRDGDFSAQRLVAARNAELADGLGNLLRRTVSMIERYFEGRVPTPSERDALSEPTAAVVSEYEAALEDFQHDDALRAVWRIVDGANKYAVERAPWTLAKRRGEVGVEAQLAQALYDLAEALRVASVLLEPFIPSTSWEVRRQLGASESPRTWLEQTQWGGVEPGTAVVSGRPLFSKE
jgi:methionyl-tRNA synthetase